MSFPAVLLAVYMGLSQEMVLSTRILMVDRYSEKVVTGDGSFNTLVYSLHRSSLVYFRLLFNTISKNARRTSPASTQ
jgi:hypothetical protein